MKSTFSRMLKNGTGQENFGFLKVQACCHLAKSDGYLHAWIDTCCINKSSSAELSEAINSMFKWYQCSEVCYVYLDVEVEDSNPTAEQFHRSRWLYRGW